MIEQLIENVLQWCNANPGFLSLVLFVLSFVGACSVAIRRTLKNRRRFRLSIIPGPNFACTFNTGAKHNGYDVTRTVFAVYLRIASVGGAPATIETVQLGYKWAINRLNRLFLKYVLGWYWISFPTISVTDFQVEIADNIKFYPFLMQRSSISGHCNDLYLVNGRSIGGVVYYEEPDAWGGCQPLRIWNRTLVKLRVIDSLGRRHSQSFWLPMVPLSEARKFNPTIGTTQDALRRGGL